jgi:hypothetical protein
VRWFVAIFAFVSISLGVTGQTRTQTTFGSTSKTQRLILTCYKPVTKVRHVCGVVVDNNQPVAGAKVSISQELNSREIKSQEPGSSGEFDFNDLSAGTYWLDVEDAATSLRVRHKIKLVTPNKLCERPLQISISDCGPIRKNRNALSRRP